MQLVHLQLAKSHQTVWCTQYPVLINYQNIEFLASLFTEITSYVKTRRNITWGYQSIWLIRSIWENIKTFLFLPLSLYIGGRFDRYLPWKRAIKFIVVHNFQTSPRSAGLWGLNETCDQKRYTKLSVVLKPIYLDDSRKSQWLFMSALPYFENSLSEYWSSLHTCEGNFHLWVLDRMVLRSQNSS